LDADALAQLAPNARPGPTLVEETAPSAADDPDTLVARTPDARGTFGRTPLVYVLVHVLDRRFSGVLVVGPDAITGTRLTLREGAVVRIETHGEGDRLGEDAVAAGACTEAHVGQALAVSRGERSLVGAQLVHQAGVSPEMMKHLLLLQMARRVATLVNLPPETAYALHLGERAPAPHEPWAPLDVLLPAVRSWSDRPRIHGTIRFIGASPLRLHPEADLRELLALPAERRALEAMSQGEVSLETLYRSIGAGLSSLVYTLAVTRQLISREDDKPPMGYRPLATPTAREAEARPRSRPLIVIAPVQQPVTGSFARADTMPEIIPVGVPRVTAPYPLETSSRPPAPVPPLPRTTLASATAPPRASTVSTVPAPASVVPAPQATVRSSPPPPTQSQTAVVDEALDAFNAAEAALAKHDLKAAEGHAIRAAHAAPKRPEYAALFAWVCAQSGEDDSVAEGVRALTRILEEHPKCEPALYYRGMLLKRAGKEKSALRDFVMILYENPTHAQALGEVRELRKKKK
jgi:hypothetical protein